ncbi:MULTISPECIES: 7-cyano-7-deazaguanine synthase [Pseudomonas]|jgi:7-cyano-7-deazaguanine synthase|uniref:7-cyano-7-deazaguanine synthase n=1 Tax=Pseudomonas savastanoi pv. nerii TaxID=360921 RepID=A0AB73Q533_PSESS|nr:MULTISPECIES: 7-cyano-7-deazaguanine synthase [Pseudomonas syringae group]PAB31422.1 7-cyano-7-deazaguanine synthase [Pseudomonas savastanoi pv. nerii]PAB37632.1 7-cyano-7-deazaguanine synthase [Pseudomonas savastanoi]
MKRALLLSGGMDSLALAWWVRPEIGITLDYGQLAAEAEVSASKAICKRLEIQHYVVSIDCRAVGSGDMAGAQADAHAPASDWWPYRNQMLVTLAAMKAISLGVTTLYLGTVKSDGSHRDGTPEFIGAISRLMALQEGGMTVEAPAIELSTAELVRKAGVPRDMLAWAHSCHKSNVACGRCRGCNKYLEVWGELDQ